MLESKVRDDTIIETLDIDYKGIQSLNNLNANNIMRCERQIKKCALRMCLKYLTVAMQKNF